MDWPDRTDRPNYAFYAGKAVGALALASGLAGGGCSAALAYLKAQSLMKYSARFDVVAINWPADARRPTSIEHAQNAFNAVGDWQFFR